MHQGFFGVALSESYQTLSSYSLIFVQFDLVLLFYVISVAFRIQYLCFLCVKFAPQWHLITTLMTYIVVAGAKQSTHFCHFKYFLHRTGLLGVYIGIILL